MGKLKIIAGGSSKKERDNARGKLFEKCMTEVLRSLGYEIDEIPNVNYAGMEIDIEGKSITNKIPLYAECKCYDSNVGSEKLQAFFGKYTTRWLKDKRSQGLFIAIPAVNSHAKGFYRENIEHQKDMTVTLLEVNKVIEFLIKAEAIKHPDIIKNNIPKEIGQPGDWYILYTDKGVFCIQYIIPSGEGIPTKVIIFDFEGNPISEKITVNYLTQLYPELKDLEIITIKGSPPLVPSSIQQVKEEIVEVIGSSSCFEYQFPASPEHFVGRQQILKEFDSYVKDVINKRTTSRGILLEGNSGWGKSSIVLACVNRLNTSGHFAVAIDSRSASSSQFILRVIDYSLSTFQNFNGLMNKDLKQKTITGFDGGIDILLEIGKTLEINKKVLFIFLDQFENLFFGNEVLAKVRDLFLKIQDTQTNVVLGFSWKIDLVALTNDFPYEIRDTIATTSKRITVDTFSDIETTALLKKLKEELEVQKIRKDLKFFLSEFSQGYPWLFKKLCAHVKTQIENHTPQAEIAYSLLNIEELFQDDLRGLSSEEQDALHRVAKLAPISIQELGEEFKPQIIQCLVNRRLLVRIGSKYDVYWDIFRDYLNSGSTPVQENYILRTQIGSILRAIDLLVKTGGNISISEFRETIQFSAKSLYNLLRDMRLLGFIKVNNKNITLSVDIPQEKQAFDETLRTHLHDRLKRNRLIWGILKDLEEKRKLTLEQIAELLEKFCPYISASEKTWNTYGRSLAKWMDIADLAIYNIKKGILSWYTLGETEVRDFRRFTVSPQSNITIPPIQYTPIEKSAIRLIDAMKQRKRIDWSGLTHSTAAKSLIALEKLNFISRKPGSIILLPDIVNFVSFPEKRSDIFAKAALNNMKSFKSFIGILEKNKNEKLDLNELGRQLRNILKADWKDSTASVNAKILLNWARHSNLAPGIWKESRIRKNTTQPSLFSNLSSNKDNE